MKLSDIIILLAIIALLGIICYQISKHFDHFKEIDPEYIHTDCK